MLILTLWSSWIVCFNLDTFFFNRRFILCGFCSFAALRLQPLQCCFLEVTEGNFDVKGVASGLSVEMMRFVGVGHSMEYATVSWEVDTSGVANVTKDVLWPSVETKVAEHVHVPWPSVETKISAASLELNTSGSSNPSSRLPATTLATSGVHVGASFFFLEIGGLNSARASLFSYIWK